MAEASVDQCDLDLHWLTPSLAVGGRVPHERVGELARYRIHAVVDLRVEECDDEAQLRANGIDFLHLPTPDMESPSVDLLEEGLSFAKAHVDAGRKVLIHCQHGIGRSALLALCLLVDQGFEPLDALTLAKGRRPKVSPSRAQYEGWAAWLESRGRVVPTYHEFGSIAYRDATCG